MERRPARIDADFMAKTVRRREKPRERWLLTRKTWKYMADAGRRLIPEGAQNRQEDIPRIEAYFQEMCQKEPRFLLWRKSSYPGVVARPRRKKRPRGGSVRARSPSDDVPAPIRPTELFIPHTSGGRFDIAKLRRDFFAAPPPSTSFTPSNGAFNANTKKASPQVAPRDNDEGVLVDLLQKYLRLEEDKSPTPRNEHEELVRALRSYLKRQSETAPADSDTDPAQRVLKEHLSRYYSRESNSNHSVQDLLSDRNLLRNLYHDLRKTKAYRGGRSGGNGSSGGGFSGACVFSASSSRSHFRGRNVYDPYGDEDYPPPMSPPPLIEVVSESQEERASSDIGTQTDPIPEEVLQDLEKAYREKLEAPTSPTSPTSPPPERRPRRRSSVDHDDVSQSVSDKIKLYLKMARKKSVDSDKTDRFKRINYDQNLRNIKPRVPSDVDDDGLNKGVQTDEAWILTYKELQFASVATTPTSPSQSHSLFSSLLGRSTSTTSAGGMQKSRSSSSVVQTVSKRLWRTRSRSSSRAAAAWTPQGSCCWTDGAGRCVRLTDTSLLTLSEVERRALQQAALARLQQLNIGTPIKIPEDNASAVTTKPKRRAYLLKRKALTTGFFDQSRKDADKEKEPTGSVFGVPLAQCVETERALRRQQHTGSRASLASLNTLEKGDDSESCDSGDWGWAGLEEAGGGRPRIPALVSACLAHLRRHGLHTMGLFRVSASKKRVRQLREEWERGQECALDDALPHDVATLLKEFLRDLPDPLLCRDLYCAFLQTQKIHNRSLQWEALRYIVQLLPAAHRDTLNALLSFLSQLASHSVDDHQPGNKMDAANIATIFAPNILHKNKPNECASAEELAERTDVINVVRQLVERQTELWTLPAELLHEAYIHLAHTQPAHLDSLLLRRAETAEANANSESGVRRVWARDHFLHAATATATTQPVPSSNMNNVPARRTRTRDAASDASSGSLSSAMTIVTRVRSSEECTSSGVICSPPLRDSAPDSNDSASDYNETGACSEDECVITASLHIPAMRPRRRSTSGSSSSAKRDSAVGSSPASPASASNASSPPASPPPRAPERRNDIERLVTLGRERNTSDARAVIVRQHDETTVSRATRISREIRREEVVRNDQTIKKEEQVKNDLVRRDEQIRRDLVKDERREGTMLYKRGELISSAQTRPA
ncbi:uncharacterized protein LOC125061813 isoform X1 [Pieris napi]|uniref:uncharacterized protein LOC125061813 isoform X1 n=2 Tax=Pieris napi TaxID=78633 RepID=UPI001FB88CAC|nr:uncharacterized protein LOC125061813 isoform X1 [Pieris napi]